jgi:hypothetical protein
VVEVVYGFEENLGGEVFGLFVVSDFTVDIVIDEAKVLLIECLEFRRVHGGAPGDYLYQARQEQAE